ncbi:MAG: hypothetical protein WDM96_14735 [Lacunisphaera sp.]
MKRSHKISLMLLGGLSASALTSCTRQVEGEPRISPDSVYANNQYVAGAVIITLRSRAFIRSPTIITTRSGNFITTADNGAALRSAA